MHIADGALIFGLIVIAYIALLVVLLRTRRGRAINRHPYRDPYGDAPGAWRASSRSRDTRSSVQSARGTR